MKDAYEKSRQDAYRLARHDVNLLMLPPSAVDEVSSLPADLASNLHALEHDLVSHFTGLGYLRDANLHARFVHRKITPNLPKLTVGIQEEVDLAIEELFGTVSRDWTEISLADILTYISSCVSARIMLGKDYAHHQEWQRISKAFTLNFLTSVTIMRYFPAFMYPILQWVLPSVWSTCWTLRDAEKLLGPVFSDLLMKSDNKEWKPSEKEDKWGMETLVSMATPEEKNLKTLIHAEILLILASVPTTVFSEINVILDLVSNQDLLALIRTELQYFSNDDGSVTCYGKLHKLDSVLRESQRLAPPTLIGLRRIMKKDHTLANGILLPKGSYICVPTYTVQNDVTNTEDPLRYDGLRSYRKRLGENGKVISTKHQFTSTESTILGFGHSRTACPGRHLASIALKIIISSLITKFDFRFDGGLTSRPANRVAHEFVVTPPDLKLLVRRHRSNPEKDI